MTDFITRNSETFYQLLIAAVLMLMLYFASAAYAWTFQSAVYASEIPPDTVCIKDQIPDSWICIPEYETSWYLSTEGRLADGSIQ